MCLRLLLAATAVSLVVSCRAAGSARFQGRWQGVRAEGVGPDALPAANAFAAGTRIEVKSDVLTITTPRDRQVGRYRVVDESDDTVVITTDRDGPEQPATFRFVDTGTMEWAVRDGRSIVFAKE
jgi:hypothetical protein